MTFALRSRYQWKLRTRFLPLGEQTIVMGVLNTTPDSFSDGGAFSTPAAAIEHALDMLEEGAGIVDVGGESTRPGKRRPVGIQEEIDRVLPVLEGILRHRPDAVLSIDTYKSETARAALAAGAEIVNDVSGFLWDEAMARVCAEAKCGVVLMHTRGRPEEWHALPALDADAVVPYIKQALRQRLEGALQANVERQRIILDPGFGFGIIGEENYHLLAGLEQLSTLERPLLAGPSRKRFLGKTLSTLYAPRDAPPDAPLDRQSEILVGRRGNATLAATTAAILNGAHLVRVHEVRAAREAAAIADAILAAARH
ncbi:MAG: dihydropteroate synthase [Acidobacteriaceae bacterium]